MGSDYRPSGNIQQQIPARIDQAAPVQNTWYTVLAATGVYTRIADVVFEVLVANETIEVEVTIGATGAQVGIQACAFGTDYRLLHSFDPGNVDLLYAPAAGAGDRNLDLVGTNALVRIRKTTANGAGNLRCKVIYAI